MCKHISHKTLKCLTSLFYLEFVLSGVALVVMGSVTLLQFRSMMFLFDYRMPLPGAISIITGIIIFIVAFMGYYGTFKQSYLILVAFSGLLLIVMFLQIATAICTDIYRSGFEHNLAHVMNESQFNYELSERSHDGWDDMQYSLECCGTLEADDWDLMNVGKPFSCCQRDVAEHDDVVSMYCYLVGMKRNYLRGRGCLYPIINSVRLYLSILVWLCAGFSLILALGIVLSCIQAENIRKIRPMAK